MELRYIHVVLDELKYSCTIGESLGGLYVFWCNYSCLIEYTKAATYIYCDNVGGGIGQDPATEVHMEKFG